MIETQISISVNRKSDYEQIQEVIIGNKIQFPVYIREYENSFQIDFSSDYEEWELDTAILNCFPEYEFTTDLEKGRKEIRVQISRYQSDYSMDNWGRQIENPLDEIKYLVKKSTKKAEKFNPKIKVLFEDNAQYYFINIVNGVNTTTDEKGFLLVNNFKTKSEDDNAEILKDKLYKSPIEAFHSGYNKLSDLVVNDFKLHLEAKKKATREIQKLPRKIIRDFINACNKSEVDEILKNLDANVSYEKRKNWSLIFGAEGLVEFKKHLGSDEQQLLGKDFKIRSSWSINLPNVNIGVKYFPPLVDKGNKFNLKYGEIKFLLRDNKIIQIIDES